MSVSRDGKKAEGGPGVLGAQRLEVGGPGEGVGVAPARGLQVDSRVQGSEVTE